VDFLFFCDIFVNFITAYEDLERNILILNPKEIAKYYIGGWFALDVAATFPVDTLVESLGLESSSKELKLARLTRMYRLIRAVRLLRMAKILRLGNTGLSKWIEMFQLEPGFMRLLKLGFFLVFLIHLFACVWFYLSQEADFNSDTWAYRSSILDEDAFSQYIVSIYWAAQTATTVGFGDILS